MRRAIPFALALVLAAAAVDAAPRPRRGQRTPRTPPPAAPPSVEASTGDGIVVLRPPLPDEVLIRGGTFMMGTSDEELAGEKPSVLSPLKLCQLESRRELCKSEWFLWERAEHEVYLSDYWIDRTEVTVARYRLCVAAGACAPPPYLEGGERFDRPEYPVVLVTWNDARRFCSWTGAGGRLPTEAEWERAARGLLGRRYPWGDVYNPFLSNHGAYGLEDLDARDGFLELAPVGSFPDGRTPDGIDDLAGNVQEWVSDWFAPEYPPSSAVNPKGPDMGDRRVVRGGSYTHGRAWMRGASRQPEAPGERATWIGFRCARDAR